MEVWNLLDKRANYILQKKTRIQMEAWTMLDGGFDYMHSYMKQGFGGN
jgi:hypothetical protein